MQVHACHAGFTRPALVPFRKTFQGGFNIKDSPFISTRKMSSPFPNHFAADRFSSLDPEPSRQFDSYATHYASFLGSHKKRVQEQENNAIKMANHVKVDERTASSQKLFIRWSEEIYFYEEHPSRVTERKLLNFLFHIHTKTISLPEFGKEKLNFELMNECCTAILDLFKNQIEEFKGDWPCPETRTVRNFIQCLYQDERSNQETQIEQAQLINVISEMQMQINVLRKEVDSLKSTACPASPSSMTSSLRDPIFQFEMPEKSRSPSPISESSNISSSLPSDVPVFTFDKTITSVKDAWKEYCKGVNGGPAVKDLENRYGAKWRSVNATKKFYSRRKILYRAIEVGVSRGSTEVECIQRLETIRTRKEGGRTTLKSLNWLTNYLKDDQQIHQIMG